MGCTSSKAASPAKHAPTRAEQTRGAGKELQTALDADESLQSLPTLMSNAEKVQEKKPMYLPQELNGMKVLVKEHGNQWRATNEHLHAQTPGLQYRKSMNMNDKIADETGGICLRWGTVMIGFEERDGWVRFEACSPLPEGWVENFDAASQKKYYHSTATGETVWSRPSKASTLPGGWVEHFDEKSQRNYYHNAVLGLTTWNRPAAPPFPVGTLVHKDLPQERDADTGEIVDLDEAWCKHPATWLHGSPVPEPIGEVPPGLTSRASVIIMHPKGGDARNGYEEIWGDVFSQDPVSRLWYITEVTARGINVYSCPTSGIKVRCPGQSLSPVLDFTKLTKASLVKSTVSPAGSWPSKADEEKWNEPYWVEEGKKYNPDSKFWNDSFFPGKVKKGATHAIVSFPGAYQKWWRRIIQCSVSKDLVGQQSDEKKHQFFVLPGVHISKCSMCCVFTNESGAAMDNNTRWWAEWKRNVMKAVRAGQKLIVFTKEDGSYGNAQGYAEINWLNNPTDSSHPQYPCAGKALDYPDAGFPAKLFKGGLRFETYNVRDLMLINVGAQRPASPTVQLELWEHWHLNPYKDTDIMKNFLKKRAEATPEEWHQMRHPPEYQFRERKLGFKPVDDDDEEGEESEEDEESETESESNRKRRGKKMLAPLRRR